METVIKTHVPTITSAKKCVRTQLKKKEREKHAAFFTTGSRLHSVTLSKTLHTKKGREERAAGLIKNNIFDGTTTKKKKSSKRWEKN